MLKISAQLNDRDFQGTAEELATFVSEKLAELGFGERHRSSERLVRFYAYQKLLSRPEKAPDDGRQRLFGQLQVRQLLLARLLAEGHRSLAQDFAVSLPALDALVAEVQAGLRDAGGVRLTGAGFGGCLVAVSDAGALPVLDEAVARYNAGAPVQASTMRFAPGPGAARIAL